MTGASTPTPVLLGDVAAAWVRRLDELSQSGEELGTPIGIDSLDQELGPVLYPGDLTILAARPGMGKTALAQQVGELAAELGRAVLIFSLEMSAEDLIRRAVTRRTGVQMQRLRQPKQLVQSDWQAICDVLTQGPDEGGIGGLPLLVDERSRSIVQIESAARAVAGSLDERELPPLGLVVLDYLQLVDTSTGPGTTRAEALGQVSRRLKMLARELSVPILALSQLNRNLEHRADRRPVLSDLRESGSIEQDADTILFIHREHVYDPSADERLAEVIVGKNRNGPSAIIPVGWDPTRMRFVNFDDAMARSDEPPTDELGFGDLDELLELVSEMRSESEVVGHA